MIKRRVQCASIRLGALTLGLLGVVASSEAHAQPAQPVAPAGGTGMGPEASPAPTAAPNPYDPSMQAGGLAPPPPMQEPPLTPVTPPSTTEQRLDDAKKDDSGRGLEFFYLNVEGGFQHVGLTTFSVNEEELTAGLTASSASGAMVGAGLGLRLFVLTLGARARAGFFSDWQLFSLGGELGVHIPIGRLDPHFDLGFGYAALGNVSSAIQGAEDAVRIRGFYGRVGGGLDVYVLPALSIGANVSGELLGMTRPGLSPSELAAVQEDPGSDPEQSRAAALSADGTSYGSSLAITAVIGLHL
ncbi:hypothetical protein [Chondromyces apiculatus]|uniref:Outer membrane protein beta-barrel domain-containing protein n=1 Tax=Chondromyces apiculatus DSM 436 TaxID=1192034 RepID=A0A017SZG0_9BACT|nr:hypothetical protein [Chondromyces apiculatus]EYF02379.1 Hypothetical protein CAP_7150 [Chondromyces apiculatus DSM 436]